MEKKNPPVTRYHIHLNILSSREFVGKIRISPYSGSKLARPTPTTRGFAWKIQTRILPHKDKRIRITFLLLRDTFFPDLTTIFELRFRGRWGFSTRFRSNPSTSKKRNIKIQSGTVTKNRRGWDRIEIRGRRGWKCHREEGENATLESIPCRNTPNVLQSSLLAVPYLCRNMYIHACTYIYMYIYYIYIYIYIYIYVYIYI